MDKHHAADCQVPEIAAATSDPFGGNKVNMGRTLSQSSAKMKGVSGLLGCELWYLFLFVLVVWDVLPLAIWDFLAERY